MASSGNAPVPTAIGGRTRGPTTMRALGTRVPSREPRRGVALGGAALVGLIATVCVANWLVSRVGVVDVGFGMQAPAAVYAVGVAFTLRDFAHRELGAAWVCGGVVVAAGLSVAVSPTFALVSGAVLLVSELADLLVYAPLARRSWPAAVVLSNCVGLTVDSVLFLQLAFGSLDYLWGQIVGKAWMTAAAALLIGVARIARAPNRGP